MYKVNIINFSVYLASITHSVIIFAHAVMTYYTLSMKLFKITRSTCILSTHQKG